MHNGISTPIACGSFVTGESKRDGKGGSPQPEVCTMRIALFDATSALVPDHRRYTMKTARRLNSMRVSPRVTYAPDHRVKATVLHPLDVARQKRIDTEDTQASPTPSKRVGLINSSKVHVIDVSYACVAEGESA